MSNDIEEKNDVENTSKKKKKRSGLNTFKNFLYSMRPGGKKRMRRRRSQSEGDKSKAVLEGGDKDAIEAGFTVTQVDSVAASSSTTERKAANVDIAGGKDTPRPGVIGLHNHGNTCFVNSVVQCLSNTDLVAEYFIMGQLEADLKCCSKERSKKFGTRGEVTQQIATIVRALWTNNYRKEHTIELKNMLAKHSSQYKGSSQHDSQEFLLWLMDKMHEDLNVYYHLTQQNDASIITSPSSKLSLKTLLRKSFEKPPKGSDPDGSAEGGFSFIQEYFKGHYTSCLYCPACRHTRETNDPFRSVSLPLKQRSTRPIFINVAYLPSSSSVKARRHSNSHRQVHAAGKTVMIGIPLPIQSKIEKLRQMIGDQCSISPHHIAIVDIKCDGFHRTYTDDDPLSEIDPFQVSKSSTVCSSLYAVQLPKPRPIKTGTLPRNFSSKHFRHRRNSGGHLKDMSLNANGGSYDIEMMERPSKPSSQHNSVVAILINKQGTGTEGVRFGKPVVFKASINITYNDLKDRILGYVKPYLIKDVPWDVLNKAFNLKVRSEDKDELLVPAMTKPFSTLSIQRILDASSKDGNPGYIKLTAEWNSEPQIFEKIPEEKIDVDESVQIQTKIHQEPFSCKLDDCFDLLTQEELLEDAKQCRNCKEQGPPVMKKMMIGELPEILILHLKRFKIDGKGNRTKLDTEIDFPLEGLDMSTRIYQRPEGAIIDDNDKKSPGNNTINMMKQQRRICNNNNDDMDERSNIYDLYAVVNHYGTMIRGHYAANCLNPKDKSWYVYDDDKSYPITTDRLDKKGAYILFYERRRIPATSYESSPHWSTLLPYLNNKNRNATTLLRRNKKQQQNIIRSHSTNTVRRRKQLIFNQQQQNMVVNYNENNNNNKRKSTTIEQSPLSDNEHDLDGKNDDERFNNRLETHRGRKEMRLSQRGQADGNDYTTTTSNIMEPSTSAYNTRYANKSFLHSHTIHYRSRYNKKEDKPSTSSRIQKNRENSISSEQQPHCSKTSTQQPPISRSIATSSLHGNNTSYIRTSNYFSDDDNFHGNDDFEEEGGFNAIHRPFVRGLSTSVHPARSYTSRGHQGHAVDQFRSMPRRPRHRTTSRV